MSEDKLSERKQKILKAVVEEYIAGASPISSGEIKAKHFDNISSATIRNELSALEEMGYLIQPHISSGRIPSRKAYSLYVDKFIRKQALTKKEIALIETSFDRRFGAIEDLVKSTAKVISDITNYTSVIVLKNINEVVIKAVKLVGLDEHSALVVIITDSGIIRDNVISLSQAIDEAYINDANALINKIFSGKSVSEIKDKDNIVDTELADFRELFENIVSILASYAEKDEKNVYFEGQSKFLESPDQDLTSAKNFLEVIDTKERFADMVDSGAELEFNVKIGKDEKGGIDKCAIVTAKYIYQGKELGCAGVIGPERMNYGKVMSVLDYIKKTLNGLDGDKDGGNNE